MCASIGNLIIDVFRAELELKNNMVLLKDWNQFGPNLDQKKIILAPFCGEISCEDQIKADSARYLFGDCRCHFIMKYFNKCL